MGREGGGFLIKCEEYEHTQLVLTIDQARLGATIVAFWARMDGPVCFDRHFFWQGVLYGMAKTNRTPCRLAFCVQYYF